jgi:hypothetical protein
VPLPPVVVVDDEPPEVVPVELPPFDLAILGTTAPKDKETDGLLEAVCVAVGEAAAHLTMTIALVSIVTAALLARARPFRVAPLPKEIACLAKMVPSR